VVILTAWKAALQSMPNKESPYGGQGRVRMQCARLQKIRKP